MRQLILKVQSFLILLVLVSANVQAQKISCRYGSLY